MVKKSSTVQPSQNAGTNVGGKEAKPPAVSSKSKANGDAPMKSAPGGTEQTSTATTETQIVGSAGDPKTSNVQQIYYGVTADGRTVVYYPNGMVQIIQNERAFVETLSPARPADTCQVISPEAANESTPGDSTGSSTKTEITKKNACCPKNLNHVGGSCERHCGCFCGVVFFILLIIIGIAVGVVKGMARAGAF